MSKITNDGLTRKFYSCTHMTTVGVKGLNDGDRTTAKDRLTKSNDQNSMGKERLSGRYLMRWNLGSYKRHCLTCGIDLLIPAPQSGKGAFCPSVSVRLSVGSFVCLQSAVVHYVQAFTETTEPINLNI